MKDDRDCGEAGTPARPISGDYARRISELAPTLGLPVAQARVELELEEARASAGVGGRDGS